MDLNNFETFISLFTINLCTSFCYVKIINYHPLSNLKKIYLIILCIFLSIFRIYTENFIYPMFAMIITYLLYNLLLCHITQNKYGYSIIVTILSLSLSCIVHAICSAILIIFEQILQLSINTTILFILIYILDSIFLYLFFKINKFKNGFQFIKNKKSNDYLDIFTLIISVLIIYMYFMFGNYYKIHPKHLFYELILTTIIMIIVLQKTFTMYQKQKLLGKTLKEYEQELKEKEEKINNLLNEESKLVKANHEFYHRQEALKYKLMNLKSQNQNFNKEYGEILSRINNLSDEYEKLTKNSYIEHKLPKCEITELDDMFSYMQNECLKNNIEFILKINGNIHTLTNNIISKNKLETLIGDLVRNSIIAINYSDNKFRSIMAILGIKDNCFEFCVYDSGIEFEIDTLSKLGIEKASTHLDNGGNGIGFITTFETLKSSSASLIINEYTHEQNNYTKSITIRFNNKFEYIINSYRSSKISNYLKNRNDIIIKSDFNHF